MERLYEKNSMLHMSITNKVKAAPVPIEGVWVGYIGVSGLSLVYKSGQQVTTQLVHRVTPLRSLHSEKYLFSSFSSNLLLLLLITFVNVNRGVKRS